MAVVILSEAAMADTERLFAFLVAHDADTAVRAGQAIDNGISRLELFPELAPTLDGACRILSIPFGKRGYSVAYVFEPDSNQVIVLGIKHQLEEFFSFELETGDP